MPVRPVIHYAGRGCKGCDGVWCWQVCGAGGALEMVNATQSATGFVGDPTAWGAAMRGTVMRGAAMRGAMTQVAAMRGAAVQHVMALRAMERCQRREACDDMTS